ncbi:ornithine cyclodeaminase [Ensifer adhaerens]|uniref:ornithine cyclodeaminase n=1 Tax=Ensifer adhaerens TaxID=106592 RepID=UPI0008072C89|nr:ornithine cyclodeaminase [Ensifer adhaerens]
MTLHEPVLNVVSTEELRRLGAELSVAETHEAVEAAWRDIRRGSSIGGKAVLSLPEDEFWAMPEFMGKRESFAAERLGWKLSSLYSVNPRFGGVKIIGANAYNRRRGLPRSTSTYLLLDKTTLRPVAIFDGTALSAARTGTYASLVLETFVETPMKISVFLFGAGPVARSAIDCLSLTATEHIERIFIRSRFPESAARLAEAAASSTQIALVPVADNAALVECAFVVTATNAREPIFEDHELARDAATLHLGGDEIPEAYLKRALRTGTVICDDLKTVSRRNSQSVSLYFSRRGLSLETAGPLLGIGEMSAPTGWQDSGPGPVCVTCVGLPMLDLYVAEATWEKLLKARG